MVGVNFTRTTVVKDNLELQKEIHKYSLLNGSQLRSQVANTVKRLDNDKLNRRVSKQRESIR